MESDTVTATSFVFAQVGFVVTMPSPDEQLSILKSRVRHLERSLAEAESLSLEQIECTHRLETQLFATRTQLEERTQELTLCRQAQAILEQRPSQDAFQKQAQHIEELQKQIWELERRPTLDHLQILKQQISTSQTEIEMLKAELKRRVDPAQYQQLQQQFQALKTQTQQLASYATQLPQAQQAAAAAQEQIKILGSQLEATQAELAHLHQQPSATANLTEQLERLQKQLVTVRAERDALINELAHRSSLATSAQAEAELSHLRQQIQAAEKMQNRWEQLEANLEAEIAHLRQRPTAEQLSQRDQTIASLQERLEHFEQLTQQQQDLAAQLQAAQARIQHLTRDLEDQQLSFSQEDLNPLQTQIQELQAQLHHAQTAQEQIHAELIQTRDQLSHWQQQAQHHLEHSEGIQQQYTLLKGELDSLRAQYHQATLAHQEHQQSTLARLESLEQQREGLARQLHKARVEQVDPAVLNALQEQLAHLQTENTQLMHDLEQRPTHAQLKEAQRRQELAEAHYLVSQKQLEKLQAQVDLLKTECVQAHAYAQTQEKEVALLEQQLSQSPSLASYGVSHKTAQPLPTPLPRVAHLPIHLTAQSQDQPGSQQIGSQHPARRSKAQDPFNDDLNELFPDVHVEHEAASKIVDLDEELGPVQEPLFVDQAEDLSQAPDQSSHGIPPLSLSPNEIEKAGKPLKAQAWLGMPRPTPAPRSSRVVELPTFVRRRPS